MRRAELYISLMLCLLAATKTHQLPTSSFQLPKNIVTLWRKGAQGSATGDDAAKEEFGTCYCYGDPHCRQFDNGRMVNLQGSCRYTMARDGCSQGQPVETATWRVVINNARLDAEHRVARVLKVTVLLQEYQLKIELRPDLVVLVNEVRLTTSSMDFDDHGVTIFTNNKYSHVIVRDGIRVTWDGLGFVSVTVPMTMSQTTCGLCGNYNGVPDDDWILGISQICMSKYPSAVQGESTTNVDILATSWTYAIDNADPACLAECPHPPVDISCETAAYDEAIEKCKLLKDENGSFGECVGKLPAALVDERYQACLFDMCHTGGGDKVLCLHAETMEWECKLSANTVVKYRNTTLCPMECPAGMKYQVCGNPCEKSCNDIVDKDCSKHLVCEEGCFCEGGLVYDGFGKCISPDSCGCFDDQMNVYLPVDEEFMTPSCELVCRCDGPKANITCTQHECPVDSTCGVKQGDTGCFCLPPRHEIHGKCVDLTDPCADRLPEVLQCFTCEGARSDAECYEIGKMKTCQMTDPICSSVRLYDTSDMSMVSLDRFCQSRIHCSPESVGPNVQYCETDDGEMTCSSCNYGPLEPIEDYESVYQCSVQEVAQHCHQPVKRGSCQQFVSRWYFDNSTCHCAEFKYGGCEGNSNNFASHEECQASCGDLQSNDDCQLEPDIGSCNDNITSYYYDTLSKTCASFQYGGCEGNGNRFATLDECTRSCQTC